MNRNRSYIVPLLLLSLAVLFYGSYGMLNAGKKEQNYSVAVIVENSAGDRWNAFKEGLSLSASEKNLYLNIVSTVNFTDVEEEMAILQREIENGADGVIIGVCADDCREALEERIGEKQMVLVETDVQPGEVYTAVMPDHYKMGWAVAEALAERETGGLSGKRIGVLSGNQEEMSQQECLKGFREGLANYGGSTLWTLSRAETESDGALQEKLSSEPVDILVALENDEAETAVDLAVASAESTYRIYAEGRSEKLVYYLDKGVIEALVVPNEYYMGYASLELLWEKLNYYSPTVSNQEIDFLTVTRDNLYDDAIEKLLFSTGD